MVKISLQHDTSSRQALINAEATGETLNTLQSYYMRAGQQTRRCCVPRVLEHPGRSGEQFRKKCDYARNLTGQSRRSWFLRQGGTRHTSELMAAARGGAWSSHQSSAVSTLSCSAPNRDAAALRKTDAQLVRGMPASQSLTTTVCWFKHAGLRDSNGIGCSGLGGKALTGRAVSTEPATRGL